MITSTGDHIYIPIKITSSGYVVNLGAQSFTAEISPGPISVSSGETELHKAYNNLNRKIRDKKFNYSNSPFWSSEPLDSM
jgi:hypothetical protein